MNAWWGPLKSRWFLALDSPESKPYGSKGASIVALIRFSPTPPPSVASFIHSEPNDEYETKATE